jgi:ABC-2 type transport system permease protein
MSTRLELQRRAQYRGSMWIWSLSSVLQICLGLAVWRVIAQTAGTVGGYDDHAIVGYFLVLMIVREATYTAVPWQIEDITHTGELTAQLVRPAHPLLAAYASASAFRWFSFAVIGPATVILALLLDPSFGGGWRGVAVAMALLPFANVARMYSDSLIACLALWMTRIGGYREAYYLVMLFLGGQFAPLDVLPHAAQVIAKALPFYWFLGFPVELAIGRQPLSNAWIGFAVLSAWIAALHLILKFTWNRGLRALETVGT